MRRNVSRRALLAGAAACAAGGVGLSLFGGSSDDSPDGYSDDLLVPEKAYPPDSSGPDHVQLQNCTGETPVDVDLTVRSLDPETVVHDVTHTVPDGFCGGGNSYQIHDVWTGTGRYRIRAESPTVGETLDLPVRVSRHDAGDEATVRLTVFGDGFAEEVYSPAHRVTDSRPPEQS